MSNLDNERDAMIKRSAEHTIQGNYALWNALLTMNTIVVSVFTVSLNYVDRTLQLAVLPLILLAIVSAGLLVANFRSSRDIAKYIGQLGLGLVDEMTDEEKKADLLRTDDRHDNTVDRERWVVRITFIQGVIVVLILLYIALGVTNGTEQVEALKP
ncbi:MAG: hypothetical protein P1U86_11760 [Verrucomicrobiales bacterium]|nr:hypothetical protein [Verrucomicrobiales bacterium]